MNILPRMSAYWIYSLLEGIFKIGESGFKLFVTYWARGWCNQSIEKYINITLFTKPVMNALFKFIILRGNRPENNTFTM